MMIIPAIRRPSVPAGPNHRYRITAKCINSESFVKRRKEMNKHKLFLFAALALVLVLGALQLQGTASAEAPIRLVSFGYQRVETIEPGEAWLDEAGLHIRGRVDIGVISGGLQGSARVVYNADLQYVDSELADRPAPTNGEAYGTMQIFSGADERPAPAWTGDWTYKMDRGQMVDGQMTAFSLDRVWVMRINSVTMNDEGILIHRGSIQRNYCGDADSKVPCTADFAAESGLAKPAPQLVPFRHPPQCVQVDYFAEGTWGLYCSDNGNDISGAKLESNSQHRLTWDNTYAQMVVKLDGKTTIVWEVCDSLGDCAQGRYP
jgi:hypothetical protein